MRPGSNCSAWSGTGAARKDEGRGIVPTENAFEQIKGELEKAIKTRAKKWPALKSNGEALQLCNCCTPCFASTISTIAQVLLRRARDEAAAQA